ncbi:MAG TPA: hypothetical protein VFK52_13135 [Nocardioidaceae bacterium]|nr:hypothetical protein [Nocardioidaceae bacterium]
MTRRRALAVLSVVSSLTFTTLLPAEAATPQRAAGLTCSTGVRGFTADGKMVSRGFANATLKSDKISGNSLPVVPRGISILSGKEIEGGFSETYTSINPDGRARLITLTQLTASETTTVSAKNMKNSGFYQRLLTSADSYYEYMVDGRGVLRRFTTTQDQRGRISFEDPVVVRRKLGSLKSLTYAGAMRINDLRTDLLWGTTKKGALVQLRIPVKKLGQSSLRVVKRGGFADVTGLVPSYCNNKVSHVSLIAVEAANNRARWFTLRDQATPKAANLVNHGLIGEGLNWRIRSTF